MVAACKTWEGAYLRRISAMSHRGQTTMKFWSSQEASIAFEQRRLAIIDLSAMGHQPMNSANGQYTVSRGHFARSGPNSWAEIMGAISSSGTFSCFRLGIVGGGGASVADTGTRRLASLLN
jgi:hypothetical protein